MYIYIYIYIVPSFLESLSYLQVEGAAAMDGRKPSIWDTFTHAGHPLSLLLKMLFPQFKILTLIISAD